MRIIFLIIFSYLFGSIPTGYLLVKKIKKTDIRKVGSGNIGATNAFRVGGKFVGIATFIIDFFKGFIPVIFTKHFILSTDELYILEPVILLVSVLGHVTTLFLKFRGGKGVATAIGGITAISPQISLICIAVFIVTVTISKYVSLGSILSSVIFIILIFFSPQFKVYPTISKLIFISTAGLIIYRHKSNILRIINSTENKIFS